MFTANYRYLSWGLNEKDLVNEERSRSSPLDVAETTDVFTENNQNTSNAY